MAEAVGKLSKMAGLSAWQWWVLLSAPFVLVLTWVRLSSGGYLRTLASLERVQNQPQRADEQLVVACDTAYALAVAIKYGPWWPRCLLRSLALGWYLARRGISFELRLGVPVGQGVVSGSGLSEFEAHAWLEHAGTVLNDRRDIADAYRPFDQQPPSGG